MFWTGDFWLNWAAKEAVNSWDIYRGPKPIPAIESVRPDPENAIFIVTFVGGDVFRVSPSGIAKPLGPGLGPGGKEDPDDDYLLRDR